ncbi:hypothetical protein CR162_10825 [Pseudoroseomonas rhizosphaerae]|uniref:Uncharacterized protein n=1 Tax=Teichococcus rhizosphaerae TaxID=1335062 RepID=A0A2C7ACW8_9PROT|nr:hypothetical protein [Pseudoroseomonas rhizosphaerae]PHK94924.1 hypothetical protein CR162_10825 [Pseudoroseomonas rhizosphaerae]
MTFPPGVTDRMLVAALVDRIIHGAEDVFPAEDARQLLRLLPPPPLWRQALGAFTGEDGAVRAGPWRLRHATTPLAALSGGMVLEIGRAGPEEEAPEGEAALLVFHRGEPARLLRQVPQSASFGTLVVTRADSLPWKSPDNPTNTPTAHPTGGLHAA